jgi:CRISPR-associated exonuclease Cas4
MNENGLVVGLIAFAVTLALLALFAWLWGRSLWQESGLPEGEVIASDMGNWYAQSEPLYSAEFQLSGRPDYLIEQPNGAITPVEVKSTAAPAKPYAGHVLQLAAYCFLVHEVYGVRPDSGIIQYRDRAFAVDYTAELEEELLLLLDEMRDDLFAPDVNRDHEDPRRCYRCGLRQYCDQRLA